MKFAGPMLREMAAPPYSGMYGSEVVAARHCGLGDPFTLPRGLWQHGWIDERRGSIPANLVFGVSMSHFKQGRYFVATKFLERALQSQGFHDTHAIGLPIAYVQEPKTERKPNSLLVMPAHTQEGFGVDWNPSAYVDAITNVRDNFSDVVVCVSPHCFANRLWVPEFRSAGFEVIRGASGSDRNALPKMAELFRRFEFVTTNGFGSLLAYASAFGAKVSIFGPYVEFTADYCSRIPFYIDNPELIEPDLQACSKAFMKTHYPDLFCEPNSATDRTEWGLHEIGFENRVSPARMRELFGWTRRDRARVFFQNLRARVPVPIRRRVKSMMSSSYREQQRSVDAARQEQQRLTELPRYTVGETELFGRTFRFVDALTYQQMYREFFERQVYFFRSASEAPLIIDGGANVGMSVLYFKTLYPRSRVIAFEADPEIFKVLESNVRSYGLEGVQLVPKALWDSETCLSFRQEGSAAGRLDPESGTVTVATCRLREFLENPVDLLKLDIEGAELRVLKDNLDLLPNVQNLFVEHHGFYRQPQNLHVAVEIFEEAGFRVYVESATPKQQPLSDRSLICGMDVQTNIFGYRPDL